MNLDLTNKTALVCGSTQGIGKASALEIAELGANVILMARDENQLKEVQSLLNVSKGQQHHYLVADFNHPDKVAATVKSFIDKGKNIHILVNNTGGPASGPVASAETDSFETAFRQHLLCNHLITQQVLDGMKHAKYGRIINIISTSVKQPLKNLGVSNTIRAAVANWSKTLSSEVAAYGITVNNVLPGATLTNRLSGIINAKSKQTGRGYEALSQEMILEIPAGRFAEPSEIASAVAFLASPAAAYINGINLPVDGGRTLSL